MKNASYLAIIAVVAVGFLVAYQITQHKWILLERKQTPSNEAATGTADV